MRYSLPFIIIFIGTLACTTKHKRPAADLSFIQGWNILSDDEPQARGTIQKAKDYQVNHLQLSHHLVHNLFELREPERQQKVNRLVEAAHENGIAEVVLWDHALYKLDYYPREFRTGPDSLIDLDNPAFWKWFKQDYRELLDLAPDIDGIVLTFIETGARIEEQHSEELPTAGEKLAYLVNRVAEVVMEERDLQLYIRTFIYNHTELAAMLDCLNRIDNPNIRVMAKETPHDFFVTHPPNFWIPQIPFPVIVEFDAAHEFNGQGVVASLFPEVHLKRWQLYQTYENVIGFSIRTDRYYNTAILDRPSEINLFAIHQGTGNPEKKAEHILRDFITLKYGADALPYLIPAFEAASPIIQSSFYTLGLNTANHSRLDFDYRSIYTRHVSGRWTDELEVDIGHTVDTSLHYWKEIVNHLAPPRHKRAEGNNLDEIGEVLEKGWLQAEELMNPDYLQMIIREKDYSVQLAEEALANIEQAKAHIQDSVQYEVLYHTFYRTLIAAQIRRAVAKVYYAHRIPNPNATVNAIKSESLTEIIQMAERIAEYDAPFPEGQYRWKEDANQAMDYYNEVVN